MQNVTPKATNSEMASGITTDIRSRWIICLVIIPLIFIYGRFAGGQHIFTLTGIVVCLAAINTVFYLVFEKRRFFSQLYYYVGGLVDITAVTVGILYTGKMDSVLFLGFVPILVEVSIHYWSLRVFVFYAGLIFTGSVLVLLSAAAGKMTGALFFKFVAIMVLLFYVGLLVYYLIRKMKEQYRSIEKVTDERQQLYTEVKQANMKLQDKMEKTLENLEKTNIMLVKKNIALLAAHEIYRSANEARSDEELLDMLLGIMAPIVKGQGGIIAILDPKWEKLTIAGMRNMPDSSRVKQGDVVKLRKESELYKVLKNRKSEWYEDTAAASDIFLKELVPSGSCVASPLIKKDEVAGLILIHSPQASIFGRPDADLIELLGEQAGILLYSRALFDEMKNKAAGLEKLIGVTTDIELSLKEDEIIGIALVEAIKNIFKGSQGAVLFQEGNKCVVRAQFGYESDILRMRIPEESVAGWVVKYKQGLNIKDIKTIKFYNPDYDVAYLCEKAILAPLQSKGKVTGLIVMTREGVNYTREDLYFLTLLARYVGAGIETSKLYEGIKRDYINSIYALAAAVDAKDHYTHGHSTTVMKYSTKMAEKAGMPPEEVEDVQYAALLHDIGKIGISESIINKPGKLTNEEYGIIKMHPQLGANIVSKIESLKKLVPLVLGHHEWMNGSGYPLGLRGEEIPEGARIISVADAYSTITSKRPYREERTNDYAVKELEKYSGTQFDPKYAKIMIEILREEEEAERLAKEAAEKAAQEKTPPQADKGKKAPKRLRVKLDSEEESGPGPSVHEDKKDLYS